MTKRLQVVYTDDGLLHNPESEMTSGEWRPYLESPSRLSSIRKFMEENEEFEIIEPSDYSLGPILDVHEKDYVGFLETVYDEWIADGLPAKGCMGDVFMHPSLIAKLDPETIKRNAYKNIRGKMSLHTFDLSVAFVKDTWRATYSSAQVALSAGHRLLESRADAVYALCRPPGHHAAHDTAGGYCMINNVAAVARFLQRYTLEDMNKYKQPYKFDFEDVHNREPSTGSATEKKKILIVDIDYHHGNGTQAIFYDDPSVYYISLHGYPDYPYLTGSEEEKGEGPGLGYNMNIPLDPRTTTDEDYLRHLSHALNAGHVADFNADIVIVSLGLDTWCEDPVGGIDNLKDMDTYFKMGQLLKNSRGCQGRPVLFVQEGGYTVEKLGSLAGKVLQGFLAY
ncbi:Arginase/deacetylase [Backusella circina FSU 941]|nr:Arginase/deacetylase [Backusella circina FSU 941]